MKKKQQSNMWNIDWNGEKKYSKAVQEIAAVVLSLAQH